MHERRGTYLLALGTIVLGAALAGCATPASGPNANAEDFAASRYDFLFSPTDHLKQLIAAGDWPLAAKLLDAQRPHFDSRREATAPLARSVAAGLNARHDSALAKANVDLAATRWPGSAAEWRQGRERLAGARRALDDYKAWKLLDDPAFVSPQARALDQAITATEGRLRGEARPEFAAFDHFARTSFFEAYPLALDAKPFLAENLALLRPRLDRAGSADLKAFSETYGKDAFTPSAWNEIGVAYASALMRERSSGRAPDLAAALAAMREAGRTGFTLDRLAEPRIGAIAVTSPTLLKHGQIDFPARIEVDLPIDVAKLELEAAFARPASAGGVDYLVVFDVALAKSRRRVSEVTKMPSRAIAAYRTVPNPQYSVAQNNVTRAQLDYQSAATRSAINSASYCSGLACIGNALAAIANAVAQRDAEERLRSAMQALQATPTTVEEPVHQPYSYDKAAVHASKLMTVHYYVIDLRRRGYFKSTFDIEEKRTFSVVYSVHDDDPDKATLRGGGEREQDLVAWEESPSVMRLSELVDHYLRNAGQTKPLPELDQLRAEMLRDRNQALARFSAGAVEERPRNDARFDSVVVVRVGRSLGTGFFVAPDVVLTNYHVVENASYVEMTQYDKQETFGRVMARDAQLDLALIRVQSRGKPLRFFTGTRVDPGQTVEVIGHPRGLEFSITRGVVSAIRRMPSIAFREARAKDVSYIQIDAAVNQGNSGGPLFLGDQVIGVNTWGVAKSVAEGLNFSIHYTEVLQFLREHLPGFGPLAEQR